MIGDLLPLRSYYYYAVSRIVSTSGALSFPVFDFLRRVWLVTTGVALLGESHPDCFFMTWRPQVSLSIMSYYHAVIVFFPGRAARFPLQISARPCLQGVGWGERDSRIFSESRRTAVLPMFVQPPLPVHLVSFALVFHQDFVLRSQPHSLVLVPTSLTP